MINAEKLKNELRMLLKVNKLIESATGIGMYSKTEWVR